jgi:Arc/MetJ-type ribon-helix-helix transcriptional regulator
LTASQALSQLSYSPTAIFITAYLAYVNEQIRVYAPDDGRIKCMLKIHADIAGILCIQVVCCRQQEATMGKKTTYVLDESTLDQVKEIVGRGLYKSMNAFVETAIKDELEKIKQEELQEAIQEAGRDPLFLADIGEVGDDFQYADLEETR